MAIGGRCQNRHDFLNVFQDGPLIQIGPRIERLCLWSEFESTFFPFSVSEIYSKQFVAPPWAYR